MMWIGRTHIPRDSEGGPEVPTPLGQLFNDVPTNNGDRAGAVPDELGDGHQDDPHVRGGGHGLPAISSTSLGVFRGHAR